MMLARVLALLTVAASAAASACPSCYGSSDTALRSGMDSAILFMLGLTGFVLTAIVALFFLVWRRARRARVLSGELFIDEHGQLHTTKEKGITAWNTF
jgi:threonine/homoserine/homoserine lactone efflux protein